MKKVGQILQERRLELKLTLHEVEKETKIRRKYLSAIEGNQFSGIADEVSVSGFVRNYTQALGLPVEQTMAIFRRDFESEMKENIVPEELSDSKDKGFHWTPKITLFLLIGLIAVVGIYLGVKQYLTVTGAPPLEIFIPADGQTVGATTLVSGKTDRDATLKIDGIPVLINQDGTFNEEIVLPKGENVILIESSNRQNKKRIVNLRVKVE